MTIYICEWCKPSGIPEREPERCQIRTCLKHGRTWHYPQRPALRKLGDRVFVTANNFGSMATIIVIRKDEGLTAPVSHYKVRTDTGDEFWAYDFEIDDPLPEPQ